MAAPAMSSGLPMRPDGMLLATSSAWSRAVLFMLDANAPGAIALTTIWSSISRSAMRLVRWISPALLAP